MCLYAPHAVKDPSASSQRVADSAGLGQGYRAQLEYHGYRCTLERKTLFPVKTRLIYSQLPDHLQNMIENSL